MAIACRLVKLSGTRCNHSPLTRAFCADPPQFPFPNPPAVQQNAVAGAPGVTRRFLDDAGQINPGYHRKLPHDRRLARDCKPVLVVDGRILHAECDGRIRQCRFLEVREYYRLRSVLLADQDCFEHVRLRSNGLEMYGLRRETSMGAGLCRLFHTTSAADSLARGAGAMRVGSPRGPDVHGVSGSHAAESALRPRRRKVLPDG